MDGHENCHKQKLVPSSLLEMSLAGLEESGVQRSFPELDPARVFRQVSKFKLVRKRF